MEPAKVIRSDEIAMESLQFGEEIHRLISAPVEAGSSFTALLELPPNQAVKLLHLPEEEEPPVKFPVQVSSDGGIEPAKPYHCIPNHPSNNAPIDQPYMFPVFAATENSPEMNSIPSNSDKVKREPPEFESNPSLSPVVPDAIVHNGDRKSTKRKEPEKKVKEPAKKSKNVVNESSKDGEKLPYVHVRARRGQATDSHSLAERARREKINARMKLLQELVPGCNKISGTAMVLDEIINHVQSLQRQVEFLSMRLAAVNPRNDINFDSIFAAESGSLMNSNDLGEMIMPSMWMEGQVLDQQQQQPQQQQLIWHFDGVHHNHHHPVWSNEDENPNFIPSENNSLLSYDSSANSDQYIGAGLLQSNQLKTEL